MLYKSDESFIHNCGLNRISIVGKEKNFLSMGFTDEQVKALIDFYLLSAPMLKNNSKPNRFGLKSLREYGWYGSSALHKLEGKLLVAANINIFCMVKAETISETLLSMDLTDTLCINHPRAVMKQNATAKILEDGSVKISTSESRLECLFRHIRNSFAHNQMYYFENDNILLQDSGENDNITARILIPKKSLLDWISIVKNSTPNSNM